MTKYFKCRLIIKFWPVPHVRSPIRHCEVDDAELIKSEEDLINIDSISTI